MKLQSSSSAVDVKTNMQMSSIKAELAQDKLHKMWDLLQSPYRDPISSLVREYVSNAFDSHIEAGVDTPVYVTLEEDQSGWYWACEDFGVGLSEDRCKNIFMKYLTSTKEETNDQIGAFGMGSKSGLGYTDVVHIRTRFDGTEYKYMLHKTTDAPTLSLIESYSTDKRNGTQIKVYLKDSWDEAKRFKEKTRNQLTYFDNVHYGGDLEYFNEEFILYKGKNFCYRPGNRSNQMHIVIGNVPYPINWEAIGKTQIDTPIALTFEIGDLPVIFTREDLRYTDDAIRKVKDKLDNACKELVELASPDGGETDNLWEYVSLIAGKPEVRFSDSCSLEIPAHLASMIDKSNIIYTPNPYLDSKILKVNRYKSAVDELFKYTAANGRNLQNGRNLSVNYYNHDGKFQSTHFGENDNYYARILMDEPSDPRKNRYIKEYLGKNYCKLYTDARGTLKLKDYKHILKLERKNRETWRFQIQWYQKWQDDHFHMIYDYKYSDIEVPEEFEKTAKVGASKVIVGTDEIRYKEYRETETNKWGSYVSDLHVTADLKKSKIDDLKTSNLLIWSVRSDEDGLKCTYRMLKNFGQGGFKVISVAQKDTEVMELLEEQNANIISLNNWYLSENQIFEAFVFFSKFSNLAYKWTKSSYYQKPKSIPYDEFARHSDNFSYRLPQEFCDYLINLFKVQDKKLNLEKLPALTSWYKAESMLESTCERLNINGNRAKPLIAFRLFPNRPVSKEYRALKNYLLINNL